MRYLLILILFSGCRYNREVAQKQFGRAAATYSDIADRYCIDKFPVRVSTDSTGYKDSKRVIDSLANAIKGDSVLSVIERGRLIAQIEAIRANMPQPENCDSLSEALYRLVAKEMQRANKLQEINNQLIQAYQNFKPVHDTVESISLQAKYAVADKERGDAIGLLKEKTAEYNKWRAIAKTRWWIMIGLGAIIGLGLFLKLRKSFAGLKTTD